MALAAHMLKDGSFLYCDEVNYGLTYSESERQAAVKIMESNPTRWIENCRPNTVAPVKVAMAAARTQGTIIQVSKLNF